MKLGLGLGLQKTGKKEYYLEFDGADDKVTLNSNPIQDNYAISFWAKSNEEIGSGHNTIIGRFQDNNNRWYLSFPYNNDSDSKLVAVKDGNFHLSLKILNEVGLIWHFIVINIIGDQWTFYVDNICKGISTIWNYSELNLDLTFGVGDISRYYFGCLDNVMISKILTDSEISLLFGNQGSEITPKRGGNPFAILGRDNIYNLWKFDEGRGLTAHDAVGGNDGTLIGGATLPIWRKW